MTADAALRRAFLVLTASIAVSRLLFAPAYFNRALYQVAIPVDDGVFPPLFTDLLLQLAALLAPLATEGAAIWRQTPTRMRWAAAVEIASATMMLLHQASFYIAAWVVVFWCGWFLAWMAWVGVRRRDLVATVGPFLGQTIVAFLFLGGAVGKWTAGYWSGEMFYEIYFARHPGLLYQQLRASVDDQTLRHIAAIYSRTVIIAETAMAALPLLPVRIASAFTLVMALGLWISSSRLYDIAFPLIGMALATHYLSRGSDPSLTPRG